MKLISFAQSLRNIVMIMTVSGGFSAWIDLSATAAHASGWNLVFNDEFDGQALDRRKWATRFAYADETLDHLYQNGEQQRYRDNDNHIVKDGHLNLVGKIVEGQAHKYESGLIRSFATFYYGYFEARVKQPAGRGSWPAFWLATDRDANGEFSWPPEIDIFDNANNGNEDNSFTVHSAVVPVPGIADSGTFVWTAEGFNTKWGSLKVPQNLSEGFNVYGFVWSPTKVAAFLNGKQLYERQYSWIDKDGRVPGPAHILLNLAVGGSWAGRYGIDDAAFPQSLDIDYVRVCRLDPSAAATNPLCGGGEFTPDPERFASWFEGDHASDLTRPSFSQAEVTGATEDGRAVTVRVHLRGGEATREPLSSFLYVMGPDQQIADLQQYPLPVPSTDWAAKEMELNWRVALKPDAAAGRYAVYLSIGKAEPWDQEGRHWLKAVTMTYGDGDAFDRRAAQPLRYLLGTFEAKERQP